MIWHITDDDAGIDDADLRIALNEIALKKLVVDWDKCPDECKILEHDGRLVARGPTLLHALRQLGGS